MVGCSNAWSTRLNCEAFTMHYLQGGKQSKRQESRSKQEQERHRRPKHAGASNKRQARDMLVQVVEHANWHKNVATTQQQHSFQRQVAALPTQSRAADTRPQNPARRTIEYSIPPPLPPARQVDIPHGSTPLSTLCPAERLGQLVHRLQQ